MSTNNQERSRRFKIGKILEKWWFKVFEGIAFLLLLSKYIRDSLIPTGWALIGLLGISILSLLVINYLLTLGYAKEIARRDEAFSVRVEDLLKENKRLEKKSRYADVIPMFTTVFQNLHNALRKNYEDKSMYHEAFSVCCENLEKAFSKITGVGCHICIKMTVFPENQLQSYTKFQKNLDSIEVRTYCRSSFSSSTRRQIDDRKEIKHPIKENTAFEHIYKKRDDCFFYNDLAEIEEYRNSSLKLKHTTYIYFPKGTSFEQKSNNWPLDYRATIVAPILPIIKETKEDHTILGLICVDSLIPGVFDPELDKHIMIGCADGIYNSFKKLFNPYNPPDKNKKSSYHDEQQ